MKRLASLLQTATPLSPREAPSLERDARHFAAVLEKHEKLMVLLFTLIYAASALLQARSKPLWYDEIITVIAASAPTSADTLHVAQHTDASPPLPHLLVHFAIDAFGRGDIAVRIPSIAAFWIFCLCMYRFTRRRTGILFGLAALLLPVATDAYTYSVEARAYAPELAFCGLALLAWQRAVEQRKRAGSLVLLGIALSGALLCQYYAVLLYLPFGGAELFRWYRRRKIDGPVALAMGASLLPVLWRFTTILGVIHGFSQSWARPYPEQVAEFWETGLQHGAAFLALLAALLALAIVAGRNASEAPPPDPPDIPDHELMAGALFLIIPVVGVASALLVTHSLALRYLLPALAGLVFLIPMLAAYLTGGRALVGLLLLTANTVCIGYMILDTPQRKDPFSNEPVLAKALEQEAVIIPDGQLFLKMWYYAPPLLRSKLLFLADDEAARQYLGFDTIDGGLRAVKPWSTVQVLEYRKFATSGRQFLVYQNELRPGWLLSKVVDEGATAQVRSYSAYRSLVQVRLRQ